MDESEDLEKPKYTLSVSFGGQEGGSRPTTIENFIENINVKFYSKTMTELEERILADLSSGNFKFSIHANKRTDERNIYRADVQRAAQDYLDCWADGSEIVHVVGPDCQEDEIEIVAGYDGETVVITVMAARKR